MSPRTPIRGDELPELLVPPPGPKSRAAAKRLRRAEGAAIWGSDAAPIVWSRARGAVVEDLDGNGYIDLTSGFGAATLGHAAPEIARAVAAQARRLSQGLGDLHPHVAREKLARKLSSLGGSLSRVLLTGTGSEAVELALKTAALVTGRRRVVTFEGGYHGQSGAALEVTSHPSSPDLLKPAGPPRAIPIPYPDRSRCAARTPCAACDLACLERGWDERVKPALQGPDPPGAVIAEPIQGRAGVILPPLEFLPRLAELARAAGLVVIWDEILTGAGRTGPFWAWQRSGPAAEPDLMTAGKGIGGGVAIGALLGKAKLMEVWSKHVSGSGESPYASTFYAHPLACAGTLAALERLTSNELAAAKQRLQEVLDQHVPRLPGGRCVGLLGAFRSEPNGANYESLLRAGVLVVPGGYREDTLSLLPSFTIAPEQLTWALEKMSALGPQ